MSVCFSHYVGLNYGIKPLACPVEYARYVDGLRTVTDNDAG